jgi:hypothetical protein
MRFFFYSFSVCPECPKPRDAANTNVYLSVLAGLLLA